MASTKIFRVNEQGNLGKSGVSAQKNTETGAAEPKRSAAVKNTADIAGSGQKKAIDREIFALAVPALGALVAEPLFILADSAIVGHISTAALGGLAIASTILSTIVGLAVFLAYSTTASVSRFLGAGNLKEGLSRGMDAWWLALAIGIACGSLTGIFAAPLIGLFGPGTDVAIEAVTYLRISAIGLPAMLVVLATTGLVRGLQDTRTPLIVSIAGAVLNVPLNYLLVFGMNLGIAGSAIGTVTVQWAMASVLSFIVIRSAYRQHARLKPHLESITAAWSEAAPLFVRTLALRAVLILTSFVAVRLGAAGLAAHQVAMSIFNLLALALDSLAIAAQALIGKYLGAEDDAAIKQTTTRLKRYGILAGVVTSVLVLPLSLFAPAIFTPEADVQYLIKYVIFALAIAQPIAGYVFVMDGIYMGAGRAKYLAKASLAALVAFAIPALLLVHLGFTGLTGLLALWGIYTVFFLGARALSFVLANLKLFQDL